jgi:hypothetical protein
MIRMPKAPFLMIVIGVVFLSVSYRSLPREEQQSLSASTEKGAYSGPGCLDDCIHSLKGELDSFFEASFVFLCYLTVIQL